MVENISYAPGFCRALQENFISLILREFIHPQYGIQAVVLADPSANTEVGTLIQQHEDGRLSFEIHRADLGNLRRLARELQRYPSVRLLFGLREVTDVTGLEWRILYAYTVMQSRSLTWHSINASRIPS